MSDIVESIQHLNINDSNPLKLPRSTSEATTISNDLSPLPSIEEYTIELKE
jgi:hypothetical protein